MKKENKEEPKSISELKEKINLFEKLKDELFPNSRIRGGYFEEEELIMRNEDTSLCDLLLISKVKTVEDIKYILDTCDTSNYNFINAVIYKFYTYSHLIRNFEIRDRHIIGRMIADKFLEITKNIILELTFVEVNNSNVNEILTKYFNDTTYRNSNNGIINFTDWKPFTYLMFNGLFRIEDIAWILKYRTSKLKIYDLVYYRQEDRNFLEHNKSKLLEPYLLDLINLKINTNGSLYSINYLDVILTCKERLKNTLDIKLEELEKHLEDESTNESIIIHKENIQFKSQKSYEEFVSKYQKVK